MEHLQEQLDQLLNQVPDADAIRTRLKDLVSVYPFNEYEYLISHLLAANVLSLDVYYELRDQILGSVVARSRKQPALLERAAPRQCWGGPITPATGQHW